MNEGTLLAIGCAVTFTALSGAYLYLEAMFKAEARNEAKAGLKPTGEVNPISRAPEPVRVASRRQV